MHRILVAYASRYGSTLEVADAIAVELCEHGAAVDIRSASQVRGLKDEYTGVVVGAPLYSNRWHRDARCFIRHNRPALSRVPVAVFALGPLNDRPEEYDGARKQLDRALGDAPWLEPVSVAVFGGRLLPDRLRFPEASPVMEGVPPRDIRDWQAIRDWAGGLHESFELDRFALAL